MRKFFALFLIFLSVSAINAQEEIDNWLDERASLSESIRNITDKINTDSMPQLVRDFLLKQEKLLTLDDKIINFFDNSYKQSIADTTYVNSLKRSEEFYRTNYDDLKNKELYLLAAAGASLILFILFLILFIVKNISYNKLKNKFLIEQQVSDKYHHDIQSLTEEKKRLEAASQIEYQNLKDACEKQLLALRESEARLRQELEEKNQQLTQLESVAKLQDVSKIAREKLEIQNVKLENLKSLFDKNLITEEEYLTRKSALLNEMDKL